MCKLFSLFLPWLLSIFIHQKKRKQRKVIKIIFVKFFANYISIERRYRYMLCFISSREIKKLRRRFLLHALFFPLSPSLVHVFLFLSLTYYRVVSFSTISLDARLTVRSLFIPFLRNLSFSHLLLCLTYSSYDFSLRANGKFRGLLNRNNFN